jgi:putative two-component system response regulator
MAARIARVLIVDDQQHNIDAIKGMLKPEGYAIDTARNGPAALTLVAKIPPDLILLDTDMPGLNGFHVTRRLKANPATMNIPVILINDRDNRSFELLGLNAGAEDIMDRPIERFELAVRVRNLLRLKKHSNLLSNHKKYLEQQVKTQTASLRDSYLETIFALARASSFKDEETGAHVGRISHYSADLATTLGMDADFVDNIFYASPMHDIGKIGIPDRILLKPGKHTAEETKIMKRHTVFGAEILGSSASPYLAMGSEIALRHHERWDGTGYPEGLAGEAIPLSARIMAICDVYDALRSRRPYKAPLPHEESVRIITEGDQRTKPGHFDPAVLDAFVRTAETFRDIFQEHSDDDAS